MAAVRALLALLLLVLAPMALGADDPLKISAITLSTNADGQQEYSVSLQILLIMTALSFIPAFVMLMTSFTRIIIVFSILRQALGLQQTPSNQILIGMALFLTLFIMAPVFDRINNEALQPYLNAKDMSFSYTGWNLEHIGSTALIDELKAGFAAAFPLYKIFIEAYENMLSEGLIDDE